jgi:pimeloyl-ACP methyl ester carboxylesterase
MIRMLSSSPVPTVDRAPGRLLEKSAIEVGRFRVPFAITPGSGQIIFAVNGAQQTMAAWLTFVKFMRDKPGFRVATMDFPGQGRAEILDGPAEVGIEEQLQVLRAVTLALAPEQPLYLVGGSWGGVLSAAYAARFPTHVQRLVLGCFRTKPNGALKEIARRGQALFESGNYKGVGALFLEGFGSHLPESMKGKLRTQLENLNPLQCRQLYYQSFAFERFHDISDYVDLQAIQARTLIVNGKADPIVDIQDTYVASRRIPDCRVELLDNVGHFLHLEDPGIFDLYYSFFDAA